METARLDLVHRRAAEYLEQLKAGVVLGTVTMLHADENDGGVEVTWSADEVTTWAAGVDEVLSRAWDRSSHLFIVTPIGTVRAFRRLLTYDDDGHGSSYEVQQRGRIITRQCAIYITKYPKTDPYALGRNLDRERAVAEEQNSDDVGSGKRGLLVNALKREQGTSVLLEHFPVAARNPR